MTTGELTCSPADVVAVKKYALASAGGFGAASVPSAGDAAFAINHFSGCSLLARSFHNVVAGASSRTVIAESPQM